MCIRDSKYEGVSPTGSHKPNTAVAQAFYNKEEGVKKIYTETGAGQWGASLAFAGQMFGIDVEVFMVKVIFDQKPYRKFMMQSFGAKCNSSPSELTDFGKKLLIEDPNNPGSLGIAISEAVESTIKSNGEAKYALGSVLGHVYSIKQLMVTKQFYKWNKLEIIPILLLDVQVVEATCLGYYFLF